MANMWSVKTRPKPRSFALGMARVRGTRVTAISSLPAVIRSGAVRVWGVISVVSSLLRRRRFRRLGRRKLQALSFLLEGEEEDAGGRELPAVHEDRGRGADADTRALLDVLGEEPPGGGRAHAGAELLPIEAHGGADAQDVVPGGPVPTLGEDLVVVLPEPAVLLGAD